MSTKSVIKYVHRTEQMVCVMVRLSLMKSTSNKDVRGANSIRLGKLRTLILYRERMVTSEKALLIREGEKAECFIW